MNFQINIINKIRDFRKKSGLSQKEFAKKINLSQQYLSDIENQKTEIPSQVIFSVIKIFGIPLHSLFGLPEPNPTESLEYQKLLQERNEMSDGLRDLLDLLDANGIDVDSLIEVSHKSGVKKGSEDIKLREF